MSDLIVKSFCLGQWCTNCYVLHSDGKSNCWVIDPGFDPEPMLDYLKESGLAAEKIIYTHAHLDHIAGAFKLYELSPQIQSFVHRQEADWLGNPEFNQSAKFDMQVKAPGPTGFLEHDSTLELGQTEFRIIHTPGHSPGSICLYTDGALFAGDTLFQGSVGRTDLLASDHNALLSSIRGRLWCLPGETVVYCGHGPSTTIEQEKRYNPFVAGM